MTYILKRNKERMPLDYEKINRMVKWGSEGLDVSHSQVAIGANLQITDGTTTDAIQDMLIKSAANLISVDEPDYAVFAGRLLIAHLRKRAYGQFEPPALKDHVKSMIAIGKYDTDLEKFGDAEWDELDAELDHSLDLKLPHAAVVQLEAKYLLKNRTTKQLYETPTMAMMVISACSFVHESPEVRMDLIKRYFKVLSGQVISLPTPVMAGVRTKTRQYSSCVKIETDDSLNSINATASSIATYVSQRAGIGIGAGAIRAIRSEIRGGEIEHTGCIPFYKYFLSALKCCSMGGIRGGAATVFYPVWHLEFEDLIVLKNNRGTEENRVRHMDYGVQLSRLFYQRLLGGGDITFFSPHDVPGLYEAFFADQNKFDELYLKYEQDESIRKKVMPAIDVFSTIMQERASTGRIYIHNVDHTNDHGVFMPDVAPVRQSNLCLEIALPTKPLRYEQDPEGEIALCTLAAINLGKIQKASDFEEPLELVVRMLDNLLTQQDYPMPAARKSAQQRRPLGIGIINYAYALASRGLKYSDGSANDYTHEMFEAFQYYALKASVKLAKERGACDLFHETKYAKGVLPIDNYKGSVDKLHTVGLKLDWEGLRADILKYGLRHSTLTALMPSETSSQISNSTNGIEPPRGLMSMKANGEVVVRQLVPEVAKLRGAYELLWDIPSNTGYLNLIGIMQKFVDQAISANTNYDPSRYPEGKVPMKLLLDDLILAYRNGAKTLYYHNTRDGDKDALAEGGDKGADEVDVVTEDPNDCVDGCKI